MKVPVDDHGVVIDHYGSPRGPGGLPLGPSRTRWITMGFRENTMGPRWCPLAARQGGVNLAAARLAGPVARRPAGVPAGLLAGPPAR